MAFKMKGSPYPPNRKGKINPNSEGNTDLKDGRSKSSTFQMLGDLDKDGEMSGYETTRQKAIEKNTNPVKNYKKGYYGA